MSIVMSPAQFTRLMSHITIEEGLNHALHSHQRYIIPVPQLMDLTPCEEFETPVFEKQEAREFRSHDFYLPYTQIKFKCWVEIK